MWREHCTLSIFMYRMIQEKMMKKGQVFEGIIEKVEFPNKGLVWVSEEERYVTVKNGMPGQKIRSPSSFKGNSSSSGNTTSVWAI